MGGRAGLATRGYTAAARALHQHPQCFLTTAGRMGPIDRAALEWQGPEWWERRLQRLDTRGAGP